MTISHKEKQEILKFCDKMFSLEVSDKDHFCLEILDSLIKRYSDFSELYTYRSIIYISKKMYAQAIEDYTKIIDLDVENVKSYNNRGTAHLRTDNYDQAIEDFSKAIRLDSNYKLAYGNRRAIA